MGHGGRGRRRRLASYVAAGQGDPAGGPAARALRKEDVIAGLDYFSQPYSLPVRLAPRTDRIGVEPEYVLFVDRDQVRLEGKLRYTIRGAKTSALEVAIPGWELDEVGPDNLVAVDDATASSGTVSIPLLGPTKGKMELELRAHWAIKAGATSLAASLPRPRADSVAPAQVAVVAADNVELTPSQQKIEGLVRQPAAPPMKLPARQQEPLYYRGTGSPATFAAGLNVRRVEPLATRETVVDRAWVQSWLTADARRDRAVFQCTTDRKQLAVRLPSDAAADRTFAFVNGRQVVPRVLADGRLSIPLASQDSDEAGPARRRFVVELQYDFRGARPSQGSLRLELPRLDPDVWTRRTFWQLVLPANEHLIVNPDGLSSEFTWSWEGYCWARRPAADQAQLELWAGATPRIPCPNKPTAICSARRATSSGRRCTPPDARGLCCGPRARRWWPGCF